MQFIKSEFKGLLPKAYEPWPNGTRLIPSNMNDLNKEEPSRYVSKNWHDYCLLTALTQKGILI